MKIICAMVMSLDGKITKGDSPHLHEWTSKEDQKHFASLVASHSVIIMGRKTYDAAKSMIKNTPEKLRIIMTRDPDKYKNDSIPNQLEFTNQSPQQIVSNLQSRGYKQTLLAGGGDINRLFFKENLVSELWLTIEPRIFGKGATLVSEEEMEISLNLLSVEKLNDRGTLLCKYKVVQSS